MDLHGVHRALVYHVQAETISPLDGNCYLESWLDNGGRIYPQWLVMPSPDSIAQVQTLYAKGKVQSVRLYNTRAIGLPFGLGCMMDFFRGLAKFVSRPSFLSQMLIRMNW